MVRSPNYAVEHAGSRQDLYAILAERARERSIPHLVAEACLSLAGSLTVAFLHSEWWALYLPLILIACYSVWGVLDRATSVISDASIGARRLRGAGHRVILGAEWVVVGVGTGCALVLCFRATGYLLGNWVH